MTPTGADRAASLHTQPDKAVDKAGCATALWKARSARFTHRHPSRPSRTPATSQSKEAQIHPGLTDPARPNIITSNRAKQTSGGRHQIGTPAAFKSESVAGFLLECLAGFVGIRSNTNAYCLPTNSSQVRRTAIKLRNVKTISPIRFCSIQCPVRGRIEFREETSLSGLRADADTDCNWTLGANAGKDSVRYNLGVFERAFRQYSELLSPHSKSETV